MKERDEIIKPSEQQKSFNPHEVCKILDVSKSTLFRWENEGRFPQPISRKGFRSERVYTASDIVSAVRFMREMGTKHSKAYPWLQKYDLSGSFSVETESHYIITHIEEEE